MATEERKVGRKNNVRPQLIIQLPLQVHVQQVGWNEYKVQQHSVCRIMRQCHVDYYDKITYTSRELHFKTGFFKNTVF